MIHYRAPSASHTAVLHGDHAFTTRQPLVVTHLSGTQRLFAASVTARIRQTTATISCAAADTDTVHTARSSVSAASAQLPTTYKRLCARRTGSSVREVAEVEEVTLQPAGEGQVLVRVAFAGVNGGCELFRVRGEHLFERNRAASHYLLGAEGCGSVAALGPGVSGLQVGDTVTFGGGGAFSEYVTVPATRCYRIPEAPSAAAAALALSATVANTALQDIAGIQAGETVLVTAAAGGTGHFAAQIALLQGCNVIATCGGEQKAARLRALGVQRVIDYKREDVAAVLASEFPAGLDVAYEGVGGQLFVAAMDALKPAGRALVLGYISQYPHTGVPGVGGGSAQVPGLPPVEQIFWGGKMLMRGSQKVYGQVLPEDRGAIARRRAEVFEWWRAGQLQAWVDDSAVFQGLGSVADAVEWMLSGRTSGKVVVQI